MEEKYYYISERELLDLIQDRLELQCLKEGGVDNWSWYGENRDKFIADCLNITPEEVIKKDYEMKDIAINILQNNYKEVQ